MVHSGEGTSRSLEQMVKAGNVQCVDSRKSVGDQDYAEPEADDEPLELSIR